MATRIQAKSRHAKKFLGTATFDIFDSTVSDYVGRVPRSDTRGYTVYKALPYPVLVGLTVVDSTP